MWVFMEEVSIIHVAQVAAVGWWKPTCFSWEIVFFVFFEKIWLILGIPLDENVYTENDTGNSKPLCRRTHFIQAAGEVSSVSGTTALFIFCYPLFLCNVKNRNTFLLNLLSQIQVPSWELQEGFVVWDPERLIWRASWSHRRFWGLSVHRFLCLLISSWVSGNNSHKHNQMENGVP